MALDSEEFRQRREKREQLRKIRQRQQKRLIIGLCAAAAVLIACGILIFAMTGNHGAPTPTQGESDPQAAVQTEPQTQQTQPPQEDTTVITLAAAGDLNITDKTVAAGGTAFNYTNTFLDVMPLLANADLTVLNFEGNLFGHPYGKETASAPQTMVDALRLAGVDMVQVANSRAISNGIAGLTMTLQNLRTGGLEPVGAFATREEFRKSGGYTLCEIRGVKIAIVAFTKGMDGMALPEGSEDCVNLLYRDYSSTYQSVDRDGITEVLRAAAEEKPDVTIALLHWGSEYNDLKSDSQEAIKNLMFREGVDAIIGTHPHYVQKMEFNQDAGTFVAYSLGDFFSDGERAGTEYSVVLELEITKDHKSGQTRITGYSYTPIYSVAGTDGLLRVVRLEPAIKAYQNGHVESVTEEVYKDMVYAMERIEARIHPKEES